MGETIYHALIKESVKQALEAVGFSVSAEKYFGELRPDLFAEGFGRKIMIEAVVKHKVSDTKRLKIPLGTELLVIDSYSKIMERRGRQFNIFVKCLSLYKKKTRISEICKQVNLPRDIIERWTKGNGYPDLLERDTMLRVRKMIEEGKPY